VAEYFIDLKKKSGRISANAGPEFRLLGTAFEMKKLDLFSTHVYLIMPDYVYKMEIFSKKIISGITKMLSKKM
jgi:hypothetical protein